MSDHGGNGHLLSPEAFADFIEERIAATDDLELRGHEGLQLTVHLSNADMRLGLESFYAAYRDAPDQLEELAGRVINALRNFNQARNISDFNQLSGRVFPMLKPLSMLVAVRERGLPMIVYRHFLADLIITYVIDEPGSVAYINEEHLERWQIDEQTLHDQALTNLRERTTDEVRYMAVGAGAQRLFIFNSQDGYDATRLLLPELIEQWCRELPGQVVIGIPNRDFLIAFSDADDAILGNVARQVQADAAQQSYGLTDQLFTLVHGQVREYEWD